MAVEGITQNPHLKIIPDHAGPHYDAIQTILINTGITNKQAVETLNASWTHSHNVLSCNATWEFDRQSLSGVEIRVR